MTLVLWIVVALALALTVAAAVAALRPRLLAQGDDVQERVMSLRIRDDPLLSAFGWEFTRGECPLNTPLPIGIFARHVHPIASIFE